MLPLGLPVLTALTVASSCREEEVGEEEFREGEEEVRGDGGWLGKLALEKAERAARRRGIEKPKLLHEGLACSVREAMLQAPGAPLSGGAALRSPFDPKP
jgi:hypothetical protein